MTDTTLSRLKWIPDFKGLTKMTEPRALGKEYESIKRDILAIP